MSRRSRDLLVDGDDAVSFSKFCLVMSQPLLHPLSEVVIEQHTVVAVESSEARKSFDAVAVAKELANVFEAFDIRRNNSGHRFECVQIAHTQSTLRTAASVDGTAVPSSTPYPCRRMSDKAHNTSFVRLQENGELLDQRLCRRWQR